MKINEKLIKFTYIAVSVPRLSQIGKTSPFAIVLCEKSPKDLFESQIIISSPFGDKFQKITCLVLLVSNLAENTPGGLKMENCNL